MRLSRVPSIELKTPGQLALMREPGITTAELNAIAEREMKAAGARSSFLGYHGYPATICTSINDQIVHGIPSSAVALAPGDVLSIDAGAFELAMWQGLVAATSGAHLTDVSHAIESSVTRSGGYGIVREYTGHFIGS